MPIPRVEPLKMNTAPKIASAIFSAGIVTGSGADFFRRLRDFFLRLRDFAAACFRRFAIFGIILRFDMAHQQR